MKLKVKADYANQTVVYTKGSTIDVTDEEASWLMDDSPGTFEEEKAAPKRTPKGGGNAK